MSVALCDTCSVCVCVCVCVCQSWSQVVRQTEALGRVMRSHADDLNSGPLHRLATLIRDKQQVKKSYQSLHQQLESQNHKVCWEILSHVARGLKVKVHFLYFYSSNVNRQMKHQPQKSSSDVRTQILTETNR